jgi:hypothetical protein
MSEQHSQATDDGPGQMGWLILGVAFLGLAGNWVLYNFAPPIGSASPLGMVIGLVAGGYLAFLAFQYLK